MEEQKNRRRFLFHYLLKWTIIGLVAISVLALVFGLGILIGERKARFSYRWVEYYHKMFAGPPLGFWEKWRSFPRGRFFEVHGNFGEIIERKDDEFVMRGRDEIEKVILIGQKTIIKKGKETIKKENLRVGDWVVVIGSPKEDGKIEAKMIRIFEGEKKESKILY